MHSGKLSDRYKGVRSTPNIYITLQIQLGIEFVSILIYCYNILPVAQHVACATICLNLMWWSGTKSQQNEFFIEYELCVKTPYWNGPRSIEPSPIYIVININIVCVDVFIIALVTLITTKRLLKRGYLCI